MAASSRLPIGCPPRLSESSPGKRYCSSSPISGSASARATMQFRMSPTAGMASDSRSRPDDPPSSATVTTAVMLLLYAFSPRSSVDRPVPPPKATILGPRARNRLWKMTSDSDRSPSAGTNGRDQGVNDPPRSEPEERDAGRAHDQRPNAVRQELQRQSRHHRLARSADLHLAVDLAQPQGPSQGQAQLARKDQQQPALDTHAGSHPAPQACDRAAHVGDSHSRSSSRWKTATGPSARRSSQPRSSSARAMER